MNDDEVRCVLANWISQAISPVGRLPDDVAPADWVADCFLSWWRNSYQNGIEESLSDAELAMKGVKAELIRLGGWEAFGEALHELSHLADALADLRTALAFDQRDTGSPESGG